MSSASMSSRSSSAGRASLGRTRTVGAGARVRWDRLGRVAMLCVLVVLAYLYLSAGIHLLSTWHEARGDSAKVAVMERENRLLRSQHETFGMPGAVEAQARRLGMMKPGERPYIVSGLPDN